MRERLFFVCYFNNFNIACCLYSGSFLNSVNNSFSVTVSISDCSSSTKNCDSVIPNASHRLCNVSIFGKDFRCIIEDSVDCVIPASIAR